MCTLHLRERVLFQQVAVFLYSYMMYRYVYPIINRNNNAAPAFCSTVLLLSIQRGCVYPVWEYLMSGCFLLSDDSLYLGS